MSVSFAETIIIGLISSGVLSTIVSAIITARASKKSRLSVIEEKLDEIEVHQKTLEKDELRTQLIMMIADYPHLETDILKLAEHYFKDLEGNWTASALFAEWLEERGIQIPLWYEAIR